MSDIRVRSLLSEMERFASYPIPSGVMSIPVKDVAERLRRAVDAPEAPQIVRTVEELEALDPETLLFGCDYSIMSAGDFGGEGLLPAVVVIPAAQVRAAREALEKA